MRTRVRRTAMRGRKDKREGRRTSAGLREKALDQKVQTALKKAPSISIFWERREVSCAPDMMSLFSRSQQNLSWSEATQHIRFWHIKGAIRRNRTLWVHYNNYGRPISREPVTCCSHNSVRGEGVTITLSTSSSYAVNKKTFQVKLKKKKNTLFSFFLMHNVCATVFNFHCQPVWLLWIWVGRADNEETIPLKESCHST